MTEEPSAGHRENRIEPRHVVIGICLVVLLVFAILNTDEIAVDFAFDTVRAPLVLLIAVCALLGFAIGWFVGRRRHSD